MVYQWSNNQSGATGGLPASAKLTDDQATLGNRLNGIAAVLIAIWLCLFTASRASADQAEQFETARVHFQTGRYEEALETYDRLTRAKADAAAVAIGNSRAYEAQGRWREATEVLETAVKAVPKNAGLWARLAQIQFLRGRYRIAEQSANNALKQDADQPLARLVRADVLTETGRIKQANEEFRWFVRYYNRKQPKDAESLLLVARGAVQYARWNRGSQVFNFAVNTLCPDALKADEHSWQAHHVSGSLLLEKYNRQQALPDFRKALAINPRAAAVLVSLGIAALQQHDLDKAEQFADRALKVNPQHVAALRLKADINLSGGKISAALELVEQALRVNPSDQRVLALQAACFVLQDGPPPSDELDDLLARLDEVDKLSLEKPSRFVRLVVALAKRNPRPGYFLSELGKLLEARRKFDVAERLYKAAVDRMPQLATPKTALGMLYMRIGKSDEARQILDDAFQADPYHVRVSNMRKVVKLLGEYKTITTEHFVIHVDSKADAVLGRYMAEYLEEVYDELVKQYGFEPPHRTHFEIYNNAKGTSAHQWFSARMVGLPWIQTIGASTGVIVALASPTAAEKPFNWARVLKHEFVHIITLQQTKFNIPHWFTEALAVTSEGYPRPAVWNQLLLQRVPKGDLRTLETLNDGFIRPKSSLDWQFAYCQSRLYAQYMIEKFGQDSIRKLLDAYRQNMPTAKAIQTVFGIKLESFEQGYREFLNKLVAELHGGIPEVERSLAELEKAHVAKPNNAKAAAALARGLLKVQKRRQARELAEKALEQEKTEPLAVVVMATLELRAGNLAAAEKYLTAGLDREKPHREVLAMLAGIKLTEDKNDDALKLFQLGRERFPHDISWVRGTAAAALKLDASEPLIEALQALVKLDADDPMVRKKLAQLSLTKNAFGDAVKYGRLALHIDVSDVGTHRILAEAYTGLKQHQRAIEEYEVALLLKPDDGGLELQLARTHVAVGQNDKAKTRLESILSRNPDSAEARKLLESLD